MLDGWTGICGVHISSCVIIVVAASKGKQIADGEMTDGINAVDANARENGTANTAELEK